MGRNRRTEQPQTPRDSHPSSQQGLMDGFLQPLRGAAGGSLGLPPRSPRSPTSMGGCESSTLERISEELRTMAAAMATKADLLTLTTTIQDALRAEMAGIRTEVSAHVGRIQALEHVVETHTVRQTATDTAISRQGELILHMRRHLEDLDNRGRRCNIRIRRIPEPDGGEDVENVLTDLFNTILGADAPQSFDFERAQRALRPWSLEEGPRDVICYLHAFPIKDKIMRKAREQPTLPFRGNPVSLYNDLSPLTLEARRALRPVTAVLSKNNITYKWGFPFALLARHNGTWKAARWPEDIPRFLEELNLPPTSITNWVLAASPTQTSDREEHLPAGHS
ncbi:Hypothetical predicted protein [Pelobates cultripes]|uniref:Uncharacterized protein n=1 Tax=Pelobates cultripes TaxID=61616 RepID=A0AAD1SU93_PELCU|nr:Hypothetical predicted protein [Pelobates cultripes]